MWSERRAALARSRVLWCVLGTLVVISLIMFTEIGETYSAADLTKFDHTETRLAGACRVGDDSQAASAVATLVAFARRDPAQAIPLHGASSAVTVDAELDKLAASLSAGACAHDPRARAALDRAAG